MAVATVVLPMPPAPTMLTNRRVEEIEIRMPATYTNEPIVEAKMFDPDTFVESGPRFCARVAFELPSGSVGPVGRLERRPEPVLQ